MGEVFEARHVHLGRRFALKFLRPELASNPDIVSRFQREAQAAGTLENENIAAVVDTGMDVDGSPFLVMEFLEGMNLAHLLAKHGPLPVPRAVDILLQACRGLQAVHAKGIIHRDLKPENFLICRRNDGSDLVKVLDFGIAKLHLDASITLTGTTLGSAHYMSFEQARGDRQLDCRADIYALGVILYELLGAAKPHPGGSYNEVLFHLISHEPVDLAILRPGLPEGLLAVVRKAMAREPKNRFQSVVEFMAALMPYVERLGAGNSAAGRLPATSPMIPKPDVPAVYGGATDALPVPGEVTMQAPESNIPSIPTELLPPSLPEDREEPSMAPPSIPTETLPSAPTMLIPSEPGIVGNAGASSVQDSEQAVVTEKGRPPSRPFIGIVGVSLVALCLTGLVLWSTLSRPPHPRVSPDEPSQPLESPADAQHSPRQAVIPQAPVDSASGVADLVDASPSSSSLGAQPALHGANAPTKQEGTARRSSVAPSPRQTRTGQESMWSPRPKGFRQLDRTNPFAQ